MDLLSLTHRISSSQKANWSSTFSIRIKLSIFPPKILQSYSWVNFRTLCANTPCISTGFLRTWQSPFTSPLFDTLLGLPSNISVNLLVAHLSNHSIESKCLDTISNFPEAINPVIGCPQSSWNPNQFHFGVFGFNEPKFTSVNYEVFRCYRYFIGFQPILYCLYNFLHNKFSSPQILWGTSGFCAYSFLLYHDLEKIANKKYMECSPCIHMNSYFYINSIIFY